MRNSKEQRPTNPNLPLIPEEGPMVPLKNPLKPDDLSVHSHSEYMKRLKEARSKESQPLIPNTAPHAGDPNK